ncbi:MAG: bifunctional DNA-formamidopyrimidine glycosylase/DNA-(apurinic or apyrimidinic site) lyase [Lentisphaeria bacterium]|nr:bifunctional DNA-formamidopyrimidine glycosylase/DNA-(apurinic or apyrimidinic site) lyase [Lentisphaerota bacterium]MBR2625694.1 bifunctional DNA-formamidopyrimidine glycosylase/DNA-(apurinic or apyrimidinic site) lyase [Lentisphaeria bacterium]
MPELPEAETIGRALKSALTGKTITGVEVFTPAMRTPLTPLKDAGLTGLKFTGVRRRGRYLLADLSDERALLMHFGMSGVVRVEPASVAKRKHEHVFIHLSDGMVFRFECTRRFSMLEVHTLQSDGFPAVLADLGVEPLSEDFTGEYFLRCCSNRATPVKNLLMDNKIVTGIGNIYAAETLFASGVSPLRPGKMLTSSEASEIVKNAREILQRAIADGGTTISDFRHVDGSEGKFVQNLQIYGKDNEKCPRCGTVIQSVRLGGRASCYCPECQK